MALEPMVIFVCFRLPDVSFKKLVRSPKSLKQLPSVHKISYPWQLAEQVALVQFVALFEDLKPEGTDWPSFGSRHEYWNKAATFVQETAGTKYLRSDKPKAKTLPDFCIKIALFAFFTHHLLRSKMCHYMISI